MFSSASTTAGQSTKTITLEAFEEPLRGKALLWYIQDHSSPQYPPGFADQVVADAPPFQKKFLVLSPNSPPGWRLIDDFDCVFRPTTNVDWSLLLTLLTNSGKPILCIIAPNVNPPGQLLQKLPTTITLAVFTYISQPIQAQNQQPITPPSYYQTILLPPLSLDIIPTVSFPQHFGVTNPSWNITTVLRDLHGAGASLVLSTSGTIHNQKQFYWYYTSKNQLESWTFPQVQNLLATLSL